MRLLDRGNISVAARAAAAVAVGHSKIELLVNLSDDRDDRFLCFTSAVSIGFYSKGLSLTLGLGDRINKLRHVDLDILEGVASANINHKWLGNLDEGNVS